MRSSPTGNNTLLRIQQEINEVAARENELRNIHISSNGTTNENGISNRSPSPVSPPPPVLSRAVSTSSLHTTNTSSLNTSNGSVVTPFVNGATTRRFVPNSNAKGVMQKFFKSRGKISAATTLAGNSTNQPAPAVAWQPSEVLVSPAKALIPADKPLRRGYVPVEERIQKELRELKHREEELRCERRKSQPDLMLALEAEQELNSSPSSRSVSPIPFPGRLRNARSYSQLLDEDLPEDTMSAPSSLRPARSLAELCDAPDEEIESPRTLIQQWESRIKQSQDMQI